MIKEKSRSFSTKSWFPWLLWIIVIIPSIILLIGFWFKNTVTWGDSFIVQVIAVILAAFIAWLIWDRSRIIRAEEEEDAARKGRHFLFLQASGLIQDVWSQIFDKLLGDSPPMGDAFDEDTMAEPPTIINRLLTYSPEEIFRRGQELHSESIRYYERASTMRWLAYSQAVQLRLNKFLEDWDQFLIEWDWLLKELENPLVNRPHEGILRISRRVQRVFVCFRELSEKLELEQYR
ncbi:hypothetical protein ACFLUH_00660 [Chloroflexota bacterium]